MTRHSIEHNIFVHKVAVLINAYYSKLPYTKRHLLFIVKYSLNAPFEFTRALNRPTKEILLGFSLCHFLLNIKFINISFISNKHQARRPNTLIRNHHCPTLIFNFQLLCSSQSRRSQPLCYRQIRSYS